MKIKQNSHLLDRMSNPEFLGVFKGYFINTNIWALQNMWPLRLQKRIFVYKKQILEVIRFLYIRKFNQPRSGVGAQVWRPQVDAR